MLEPLFDRVILELIEPKDTTPSGLFIPEKDRVKNEGKVVAVGPGRINEDGERMPMTVKVGDRVLFTSYGGTDVEINRKKFRILTEGDILAVLK